MKQEKDNLPKKPLIFYYIVVMLVVMALNTFLFPKILEKTE